VEYLGVIAIDLAPELVSEFANTPGGEVHAWTEEIGGHEARALLLLPPGVTSEHEEWPEVLTRVRRAFDRVAAEGNGRQ
jgi:hypothetical protein